MVIYEGNDSVSITFDDGPNPEITPKILDVLKDKGVKATFFVIGARAEEYPEVVKRIVAEGHDLGNHTYSHQDLANLLKEKGQQAVEEQIKKGAETIKRVAGVSDSELQFLRPPGLNWDAEVNKIAEPFYGDKIIMATIGSGDYNWNYDSHNWNKDNEAIIDNKAKNIIGDAGSQAKPGSIITLHDSAEYGLPGQDSWPTWKNRAIPTLQALPIIIDNLQAKGLVIKKLSETDLKPEPIRL